MTNRFLHYVNLLYIGIHNTIKQSVIIKTKDLINVFPIHKTHTHTCVLGDVLQQEWVFGQSLHLYGNDVLQL